MEEVANATSKVNSKIIDYAQYELLFISQKITLHSILEIFLQWTPIVDGEEV